ncbi:hypothetical protein [Rhizobium sp. Leaf262]|uniref:hypothetical protein n=1 Tax=Rhizobium sp. Leaf262 TaxID=1736312 RepID=UPI000712FEB1|nr:hypothetical protein [Rhizobium sp. Leaf262]KQO79640.1 hypothetical protein ASF29_21490 [Rhizobium sp. Leaf262]
MNRRESLIFAGLMALVAAGFLIVAPTLHSNAEPALSGQLFLIGMVLIFATVSALFHILLAPLFLKISVKTSLGLLVVALCISFLTDWIRQA